MRQLGRRRQFAKQQQVGALLEARAPLRLATGHELLDIDAAIDQLAGNRHFFVFGNDVPVDRPDAGQADQYTRAIGIAQATLDVVIDIQLRINRSRCPHLFGIFLNDRVFHRGLL